MTYELHDPEYAVGHPVKPPDAADKEHDEHEKPAGKAA
jgi:hypothetical protein